MARIVEKQMSFGSLNVEVERLGMDFYIVVRGGEREHIGCAVLAVPRQSLTGDGTISCTSSVLNVVGHKDEVICRYLAETVAKKNNATVLCTGGFHIDHITKEQIAELENEIKIIAEVITKEEDERS